MFVEGSLLSCLQTSLTWLYCNSFIQSRMYDKTTQQGRVVLNLLHLDMKIYSISQLLLLLEFYTLQFKIFNFQNDNINQHWTFSCSSISFLISKKARFWKLFLRFKELHANTIDRLQTTALLETFFGELNLLLSHQKFKLMSFLVLINDKQEIKLFNGAGFFAKRELFRAVLVRGDESSVTKALMLS